MNKLNLQNSVSSRQDLKALILELRGLARWLSQASTKQRFSKAALAEQPAVSAPAQDLINQWQAGKAIDQKSLEALIAELEAYEADAPSVGITLAAPAPRPLKNALVDWCRQNIGPDILVDFKFNSTMLGGMVISYGSHVFDWSFKRQILAARDKFPEVLRSV